jgi:hypothetical protein
MTQMNSLDLGEFFLLAVLSEAPVREDALLERFNATLPRECRRTRGMFWAGISLLERMGLTKIDRKAGTELYSLTTQGVELVKLVTENIKNLQLPP